MAGFQASTEGSLHHKVFDLGAFTIHTDHRVLVSERVHGGDGFERVLLRHHGARIRRPLRGEYEPAATHLVWHRREEFKEGARSVDSLL
jgi:putative restriction endonuclease